MGENLHKIIMDHAPEYWAAGLEKIVLLNTYSREYQDISKEVLDAIQLASNSPIKTIQRYQNVHDFGQFLVREQHLLHLNPDKSFFRVSVYYKYIILL